MKHPLGMFLNWPRILVFDANFGGFNIYTCGDAGKQFIELTSFLHQRIACIVTMSGDTLTEAVNSDQITNAGIEDSKGEEWKPTLQFWLALAPLTVLAMMVSLDGTSVSVALPVWLLAPLLAGSTLMIYFLEIIDHCKGSSRLCN